MAKQKRLTRSRTDHMLAGVCGGIAEYLDTDPTLVRIITVIIAVLTAVLPALIAYLVIALIMPESD